LRHDGKYLRIAAAAGLAAALALALPPAAAQPAAPSATGIGPAGASGNRGRWLSAGTGDCGGRDVGSSQGPAPRADMCSGAGLTAICWDGAAYSNANGGRPWCTYKRIAADQCAGGGAPGRRYRCEVPAAPAPVPAEARDPGPVGKAEQAAPAAQPALPIQAEAVEPVAQAEPTAQVAQVAPTGAQAVEPAQSGPAGKLDDEQRDVPPWWLSLLKLIGVAVAGSLAGLGLAGLISGRRRRTS
jgi:hypothetical protein